MKVFIKAIWITYLLWCFIWGGFVLNFIYSIYIQDMKIEYTHKKDIKKGTKIEFYVKDFIKDLTFKEED